MSERGSFCTEYIYCDKCLAVARSVLLGNDKHLCSRVIPSWLDGEELPIIAGKIGGAYRGEELHDFAGRYGPELAARICHFMRVAVLAEGGEQIFLVTPEASEAES